MMYLFAVPFLEGLALYLMPLLIGRATSPFLGSLRSVSDVHLRRRLLFQFPVRQVPEGRMSSAIRPLRVAFHRPSEFWVLGLGLVEVAGISAGAELR